MGAGNLISRRRLLTGSRQEGTVIRPPWTPVEEDFIEQCRRCGDCVTACETGLLKKGSGGFPEADFSKAGCSFCQSCSDACQYHVIRKTEARPWNIAATITSRCLALNRVHCRTCQEICEADAITFKLQIGGVATPAIDIHLCTGCGECVAPCPVDTITMISLPKGNIL
ncbi:ferredoxin-type protein NapF [Endozoicomonas sp.]|uniref:ferredoxin-type protein NapF n=1 Tax=Endozoicomonas sp. TaxID=1892382 RepID=UPI0028882F12|nr:ferredoxin-type protein NapF [Endozoicomonas sp.]